MRKVGSGIELRRATGCDRPEAQLREPIVKRLPRCERMFRLWKISAIDMVRNAIVIPSALFSKVITPCSM